MARRRPRQTVEQETVAALNASDQRRTLDEADGVRVGEEPVPGMRLRCICRGHTDAIGRIAWSPCGRFIASPSEDSTIRIWNANDGKCRRVLRSAATGNYAVAWSPDGELLASGGKDAKVTVWSLASGKVVKVIQGHNGPVHAVAWSRQLGLLASASSDKSVRVWNAQSWEQVKEFDIAPGYGTDTHSIAWSPSGELLAMAAWGDLRIWNAVTGLLSDPMSLTRTHLQDLSWSPNSRFIAVATFQHAIDIWNAESLEHSVSLEGHAEQQSGVSFSRDGMLLGSKSTDGTFRLWSTSHWQLLHTVKESSSGDDRAGIAFNELEPTLATLGESDTLLRLWAIDDKQLLVESIPHVSRIYTSAKIVLVGESNVGKSCLAMRLAEDRYPEDHEHGTTHGMRFWPIKAEELHPGAKSPEGQRRDVVLWDFGGQDE